jgi:hypothetical protein
MNDDDDNEKEKENNYKESLNGVWKDQYGIRYYIKIIDNEIFGTTTHNNNLIYSIIGIISVNKEILLFSFTEIYNYIDNDNKNINIISSYLGNITNKNQNRMSIKKICLRCKDHDSKSYTSCLFFEKNVK